MLIEPFRTEDIPGFLELATLEGWLADSWEFTILLTAFTAGCFVARLSASGPAVGFITALKHDRSGWIGNLIVSHDQRGQGIGETLFIMALNALKVGGAETVWLTASILGKSLYEKHGFSSIDTINRWSCRIGNRTVDHRPEAECKYITSSVSGMDFLAWGDRRDGLLAAVVERGTLLMTENGFLVVQPCGASMQIGPFSALDSSAAEQLLESAFLSLPQGTTVCVDAPASNLGAEQLFTSKGMHTTGSSELMYAGEKPSVRPDLIYGLASMGSMG